MKKERPKFKSFKYWKMDFTWQDGPNRYCTRTLYFKRKKEALDWFKYKEKEMGNSYCEMTEPRRGSTGYRTVLDLMNSAAGFDTVWDFDKMHEKGLTDEN